jgi:hypothetical protein
LLDGIPGGDERWRKADKEGLSEIEVIILVAVDSDGSHFNCGLHR